MNYLILENKDPKIEEYIIGISVKKSKIFYIYLLDDVLSNKRKYSNKTMQLKDVIKFIEQG